MGLAISRAASALGARVVIVGRGVERTQNAAALMRANAAEEVVADICVVTDPSAVEDLMRRHEGVDHVAITISTGGSVTTIPDTPVHTAGEPFDNRFWPTYCLLHAAPRFMSSEGSIILTFGAHGAYRSDSGSTARSTQYSTGSRSPPPSNWHGCG
jgi:NAD(P)-dependent dehydrogenase (short-subunit alcohol dehydrogenase family)